MRWIYQYGLVCSPQMWNMVTIQGLSWHSCIIIYYQYVSQGLPSTPKSTWPENSTKLKTLQSNYFEVKLIITYFNASSGSMLVWKSNPQINKKPKLSQAAL